MALPPVGSLVVPSPDYRESMGTGEGAALLMAVRRGSAHLYYPSTDRGYWVSTGKVGEIPPEAVPEGSLERLLTELLLFVEAEACEIEESEGRAMALAIEIPETNRGRLRELEGRLGPTLADFALEPGSMRALVLRLRLVDLPPAAGADN